MSGLPSSFDNAELDDSEMPFLDKMINRCKEEPLVPLGSLLTCGALLMATRAVKRGARREANKWFRWRVGMQGLTVVAMVAGSYYFDRNRKEKKSQDEILREKAELREKLWIEELERRDEEVRERRRKAALARQSAESAGKNESESK